MSLNHRPHSQMGQKDARQEPLRRQLRDLGVQPEVIARVFPIATIEGWLKAAFDLGNVTVTRQRIGPPRRRGRPTKPVEPTSPGPEHPKGRQKIPWRLFKRLKRGRTVLAP